MRFIICDDDPVIRYLLEVVLAKRGGHDVVALALPEDVATTAAVFQPDGVLIDFTLPGRTGVEVARELALDPKLATIPVVVLTGRSDLGDDFAGTNIVGVIEKPFDTTNLVAQVEQLISGAPVL